MIPSFKKWLEANVGVGTGLEPPKHSPLEGGPGAFEDYPLPGSKEKPPTPESNFKMKKKCKRK